MMIFFNQRLAYLAVPKTGTSAFEKALGSKASAIVRDPPGLKHTNARGYENKFRKLFERPNLAPMETMAVLREPVDWLGSWYRYRQRPALDGHQNSTRGCDFNQFVEAYLSESQPPFAQIGSQARFVTDAHGDLLVNHLFCYEDLRTAQNFLEDRLGFKFELRAVNTSPKANLELSVELSLALQKKHALDFQIHEALLEGPLSVS